MFFKKWLKNRATILIHCGIISIHSNLKWEGDYIMSDDSMQAMLSLILSEVRDNGKRLDRIEQRLDKVESKLELHDAQFTALISGQTVLINSIAEVKNHVGEVKDTLSAKIDETQKDKKVSKEISRDMLYDIAELKKKVK